MAKRGRKPESDKEETVLFGSEKDIKHATGSVNKVFSHNLINQTTNAVGFPENPTDKQIFEIARSAIAELESIAPNDGIEGLLAAQMVATHNAAMECYRKAMLPNATFDGRELNLKYAAKLSGIYARQIDTLDKHRGRGQQKITVEHVNVHKGGQAIVGNVETTASGISETQPALKTIENISNPELPTAGLNTVSKRKTAEKVRSRRG
jgi:hypothetical protein